MEPGDLVGSTWRRLRDSLKMKVKMKGSQKGRDHKKTTSSSSPTSSSSHHKTSASDCKHKLLSSSSSSSATSCHGCSHSNQVHPHSSQVSGVAKLLFSSNLAHERDSTTTSHSKDSPAMSHSKNSPMSSPRLAPRDHGSDVTGNV